MTAQRGTPQWVVTAHRVHAAQWVVVRHSGSIGCPHADHKGTAATATQTLHKRWAEGRRL